VETLPASHPGGIRERFGPEQLPGCYRALEPASNVAYTNTEKARILTLQTPGSGEAFYRDTREPSTEETDAERPADLDRFRAAAECNPSCIQILGPPPFEAAEEVAARA
jgi:hypothetical protein